MGGHKGGGGAPAPAPAPVDHTAEIMAQMERDRNAQMAQAADMNRMMAEQAEAQRRAAAEAARQAAIASQNAGAQQMVQQGNTIAAQGLQTADQLQMAKDQAALTAASSSGQAGAGASVGGGYDLGKTQQQAYQNLGAAAGGMPQTPANLAGTGKTTNPAVQGAAALNNAGNTASQYTPPSISGIKFGGM